MGTADRVREVGETLVGLAGEGGCHWVVQLPKEAAAAAAAAGMDCCSSMEAAVAVAEMDCCGMEAAHVGLYMLKGVAAAACAAATASVKGTWTLTTRLGTAASWYCCGAVKAVNNEDCRYEPG